MSTGVAPAPREGGWLLIWIALVAFLIPQIPLPIILPLRAVLPIVETAYLLVPAIAACFVLGWMGGGSLVLAAIWIALAAVSITRGMPPDGGAYADLVRGWSLLVPAAFGVVSVAAPRQRFFPRALGAVAFALLMGFLFVLVADKSTATVQSVFSDELARRNAMLAQLADLEASAVRGATRGMPWLGALLDRHVFDVLVRQSQGAARLFSPLFAAMLALESIAALALAWVLYHRLNRVRLGESLAPLRDFGFSDQLIWGFVAGLVLVLIPGLEVLDTLGRNLLVFFGALFVLRGAGVVAWSIARVPRGRILAAVLAIGAVLLFGGSSVVPALGTVFGSLAVLPPLGLGLSDSWMDWRARGGARNSHNVR